jgi:hypothetical protein
MNNKEEQAIQAWKKWFGERLDRKDDYTGYEIELFNALNDAIPKEGSLNVTQNEEIDSIQTILTLMLKLDDCGRRRVLKYVMSFCNVKL